MMLGKRDLRNLHIKTYLGSQWEKGGNPPWPHFHTPIITSTISISDKIIGFCLKCCDCQLYCNYLLICS